MTTELTKAAQQALEALDEIHAGKRHPQLALAVAHNLRRALTPCPAAQTDSMGMPTSCGKPLCSPDEHHPLCKLHKPVERPAAQEGDERASFIEWLETTWPKVYPKGTGDELWRNGHLSALAWKAARASLPAPQQATPEPDDDDKWRDVALRFDKHRMQALWHLQAMLQDPVKHADIVRQFLKDPTHPAVATPEPEGWTDADADAARLAMELECLLLDTKDTAAVSRWWKSANEALDLHRARLAAAQAKAPAPQTKNQQP